MKLIRQVRVVLAVILCLYSVSLSKTVATPRVPTPPWPETTLKIYGWDSPFWQVPWNGTAINEETATFVESWSGYALVRDGLASSSVFIPVAGTQGKVNVAPAYGTIRFWFAARWSTAGQTGGGPGHLARLLELVKFGNEKPEVRWSLYVNETGDTIYFTGQGKYGATDFLKASVSCQAGDWRMVSVFYSAMSTALWLDGELVATGDGIAVPASWETGDLALVVGSDIYASPDSAADAWFEELTTFGSWPKNAAEQQMYFNAMKRTSLLGPVGTKEEELVKQAALKEAGFGGEQMEMEGGEGNGPLEAFSFPSNSLWLEITGISNGLIYVTVHGTIEDSVVEILTKDRVTNAVWASETTLIGAAGQDWTPTIVSIGTRTNSLFLWARSWMDSDGSGLPDWWQLQFFGQLGVDPYADPDNDGWTNLQEYQNGTNPNQFNTPPPPSGFTAKFIANGQAVLLSWQAAAGAVTGYTIERRTSVYFSTIATVPASATSYTNQYLVTNNTTFYRAYANYATDDSDFTPEVSPLTEPRYSIEANIARGPAGKLYFMVPHLPDAVTELRFERVVVPDAFYPIYSYWGIYSDANFIWESTSLYVPPVVDDTFTLPVEALTNDFCELPAGELPSFGKYEFYVSPIGSDGRQGERVHVIDYLADTRWPGYNGRNIPFMDGRTQIKQNIEFQLRAGKGYDADGFTESFNLRYDRWTGNHWQIYESWGHHDYVYAGFHFLSYSWFGDRLYLDELHPFERNYFYRNFLYSTADTSTNGSFLTGAGWDWAQDESHYTIGDPKYLFQTYSYVTNGGTNIIFSQLSSNVSQWIYLDQAALHWFGWDGSRYFTVPSNTRNLYGLSLNSIKWPGVSNPKTFPTAYPGNALDTWTPPAYFYEMERPNLSTVSYYFGRQLAENYASEPLPGEPGFQVTNTTPLLVANLGEHFFLTAWAKQAILNGYSNKFAYAEQYFDKALKMTNSVVTTNETGILSPYGEFFATEPGPTALVTMPDTETGQRGTGLVHVIKLQLDANHDGVMDTSWAGPDNTSWQKPYAFWVNNDRDVSGSGTNLDHDVWLQPGATNNDYSFGQIRTMRNLEDFSRLWICGMPALSTGQDYSVQIAWSQIDSGTPKLRLYWASETNGGIGYLTNITTASLQIIDHNFSIGEVTPASSLTLPPNWFTNGLPRHFLFEAGAPGKGALTLTIFQGTNTIAQTSAWLDFHDIKDFYEEVAITNVIQTWPEMVQQPTNSGFRVQSYAKAKTGDDEQMAVFVHGWRMPYSDYSIFSQTMFKRLFWQGYHGKFAALRWPTRSKQTELFPGMDYITYNRSEHIAFKSGTGAAAYFNNLRSRFTNYSISACAHSMGGIVAMQTLKELANASHQPLNNLVLMQAAVPAHCFDPSATSYGQFLYVEGFGPTPDTYRNYAAGITNALRTGGKIVNFFNPDDLALTLWRINQGFYVSNFLGYGVTTMKPNTFLGYYTDGTNSIVRTNDLNQSFLSIAYLGNYENGPTRSITNIQELMPFVARPRSEAVGSLGGVRGQILGQEFNLQTQLGFTNNASDHSGQFNRNIQEPPIWPFYFQLRTNLFSPQ